MGRSRARQWMITAFADIAPQVTLERRAEALAEAASVASLEAARAIAHAAATGLWATLLECRDVDPDLFPAEPAAVQPKSIPVAVRRQATAFGRDLAQFALPDAIAEVGRLYTHALPAPHRAENGVFYTPPALVMRLLDRATSAEMDWLRGKAISPACGGGQFLIEDARRMAAAMGEADPAIVVASIGARLRGWDIDPFACWLSHLSVEAALLPQIIASGKRLPAITECRDSLTESWAGHEGAYDLVNENPAFGKVKKSDVLARRFGRSQRGHMNLYGLFTDLSLRLAKPQGGILALLTPTSYLGGEYFAKLRNLLHDEARPTGIDLVESREDVFPDVLQEVALSCFVRGRKEDRAPCSVIHVEPGALRIQAVGDLVLPAAAEEPWIVARSPEAIQLVKTMHAMRTRLADWGYHVRTGPLVPHKNDARMKALPGRGRVAVVWAECVTPGGGFAVRCERPNRLPYYEPKGANDANLVREPCLLLQRTTAKEQHRRLIGAVMSTRAIQVAGGSVSVENHLNMLVPLVRKPPVSLAELAAFFASDAADQAFRCISGSVAVSATELEAMPLPSVGDLKTAVAARDSELALGRLYGIEDDQGYRTEEQTLFPATAAE